jgi:phosphate:Na+ symporter
MELQKVIFYSVGGLGVFLFGMTMLSDGLQKLAGTKMRNFIRAFTSNNFKGLLVGTGVTAIVQSSSVTTVMLVGLLNAGVMTLRQSIGVVYGANIGTTVTAQIIAFKIIAYALPMVAIGFIMHKFIRIPRIQYMGQVLISLGFIFLGLKFMTDAFSFMKNSQGVMEFCATLSVHPFLAILVGLILTVIVQSSSASIGITIAMATTGLIDFPAALYLLLGDNIGTTVTAWLASIGSTINARRMALSHSLFNIIGAAYFAFIIQSGYYTHFINWITPGNLAIDNIARHIANAHSCFNIFNSIVLFPFIGFFAWLSTKVFQGEDDVVTGEAKFLDDHLLDTPEVAMEQVRKELHHMTTLSEKAFNDACESYIQNDPKRAVDAIKIEAAVDSLQQDITRYLVKVFSHAQSPEISNRLPSLLHSVNDIEKISDHAESIAQMTLKRQDSKYFMSEAAVVELNAIYSQTQVMFKHTAELLNSGNTSLGSTIFEEEGRIDILKKTSVANHIERLRSQECHPLAGLGFVAFVNHVEKIGDHLTNVTEAALSHYAYDGQTVTA